jgi:cytochrome b pre-mRNA-processing protein 3
LQPLVKLRVSKMNIIKNIFSFSDEKEIAHKLYKTIVKQARLPAFYENCGVADTFDGRFDMISLHMILIIRRMKRDIKQSRKISQALFDYMFDDIDLNLRELGIGDMGVLHRVKKMTKAFYGRLESYDQGLNLENDVQLSAALERNLYRENDVNDTNLRAITAYTRQQSLYLDDVGINSLLAGELEFRPPPVTEMKAENEY